MGAYSFARHGRSRAVVVTVALVWGGLVLGWVLLDVIGWILAFVALFTLPALWDLWRDPTSGLTLSETTLGWHAGRRSVRLRLDEIDHVRLDTRLDFSVRATAVLKTGRKLRLPAESTPPHHQFEAALQDRGVRTQRHHFTLMQ